MSQSRPTSPTGSSLRPWLALSSTLVACALVAGCSGASQAAPQPGAGSTTTTVSKPATTAAPSTSTPAKAVGVTTFGYSFGEGALNPRPPRPEEGWYGLVEGVVSVPKTPAKHPVVFVLHGSTAPA